MTFINSAIYFLTLATIIFREFWVGTEGPYLILPRLNNGNKRFTTTEEDCYVLQSKFSQAGHKELQIKISFDFQNIFEN